MLTVNIHAAKTNLSKLIQLAVDGHPFVIAKSGKPLVKVTAIEVADEKPKRRIGFAEGLWTVPDDFDTMFQQEIEDMFYNSRIFPDAPDAKEPDGDDR